MLCCIDGLQARLLELLGRLLELPANLDYLLSCGQLLPAFVRSTRVALDHCNSLEADEPSMMTGGEAASRLSMLLQVLVAVLEHTPSNAELVSMQEQLVSCERAGECEQSSEDGRCCSQQGSPLLIMYGMCNGHCKRQPAQLACLDWCVCCC